MARIDDLPPLRDLIRKHDLVARRSLGQNFLLDLNLTTKIARAAGDLSGLTVIEIGPGPGGLTRALLGTAAERVIAIERDERCLAILAEIADRHPGRLEIVHGDALATDLAALAAGRPAAIVANLPYNIATPLIVGWLSAEPWPPWYRSVTVMVQREVADRLTATPARQSDYGRLAVLVGATATAATLFDVPPSAFTPPPKVVSSVVHMVPRAERAACPLPILSEVTLHAFGQRRKMLRQSLKGLGNASVLLDAAGIDGSRRAETLTVEEFAGLARALAAAGQAAQS